MTKTSTRAKSTTKSRTTTKKRVATKPKTRVAAVAKPKGLHRKVHHHAKRLYHATPKFIHGMIVGGIVGVLVVGFLGGSSALPHAANAATGTPVKQLGTCTVKTDPNNTFSLGGGNVTATFDVTGDCVSQDVTLVTWTAPNPNKGKPYNQQNLFSHTTGNFKPGTHTLTTTLPNCYYQIDLITGTNPTDSTGGPGYSKEGRLRRSLHGGTQACDSTTVPVLPPAPTPTTPNSTLPDTGPAALFVVLGLAVVGGYVFHMTHHHVKKRRHAKHAH